MACMIGSPYPADYVDPGTPCPENLDAFHEVPLFFLSFPVLMYLVILSFFCFLYDVKLNISTKNLSPINVLLATAGEFCTLAKWWPLRSAVDFV